MSDEQAERVFVRLRWSDNNGAAYCPHCGCLTVYACRRPNGGPRRRCKACRKDFSVTSGTVRFHKMPLRSYLMAVAIFCNEVKGKSMLALSRDLGTQYKTAFVLAHKIREAMAAESRGSHVGGPGRKAEVVHPQAAVSAVFAEIGGLDVAAEIAAIESDRKAQGRRRDPRARRQDAAGRFPQRS
jgi:transposase-like protein